MSGLPWLLPLLLVPLLASRGRADDAAFEIQEIATQERTIQADLEDLDGDGRGDLLWIGVQGLPPDEERGLRVHFGTADGVFAPKPDWSRKLPGGAAAYDLAELDSRKGAELLLLRRDRVTTLSLHGRAPELRDFPIAGEPTIAVTHDERGLDRFQLARPGLGAPLRLLVPGFGRTTLLESNGVKVATLEVGARANFFVPPRPGALIAESEMEIYFDHPRISSGDVDGDGRADLIATDRHELRVFRQREDGGFPSAADQRIGLGRLSHADHIRSSGSVRIEPHDFDGDGRADLLLSVTTGSVFGGTTQLTVHRNLGGTWNLDEPDQQFASESGVTTTDLLDLDGDGQAELVSVRIPTGVLEIVEMLLTQAIDAEVKVYRRGSETPFATTPWVTSKQDIGISFETLRPTGFISSAQGDFNGDGRRDLIGSGGGEQLELRLGHPTEGFEKRTIRQALDTGGRIRFGRLEGDGHDDFVIYDPRRPGTPLRVGRSRLAPTLSRSRPAPTPSEPAAP